MKAFDISFLIQKRYTQILGELSVGENSLDVRCVLELDIKQNAYENIFNVREHSGDH